MGQIKPVLDIKNSIVFNKKFQNSEFCHEINRTGTASPCKMEGTVSENRNH